MQQRITDLAQLIKEKAWGNVKEKCCIKSMTSLRIGGTVELLYYSDTISSLQKVMQIIHQNQIKYYVIGLGTNMLITDEHLTLVLISLKNINHGHQIDDENFYLEAGCNACFWGYQLAKKGYSGSELLAIIPGSIGGLIWMNAGAYHMSVSDFLVECLYMYENGELERYQSFAFDYRKSIFQQLKGIIISSVWHFKKAEKVAEPYQRIKSLSNHKKATQPVQSYNAGSTFKNNLDLPTWQIIDRLGFRGRSINDAYVSDLHTNFLINKNQATYHDMMTLIEAISTEALIKYDYLLECEWQILANK